MRATGITPLTQFKYLSSSEKKPGNRRKNTTPSSGVGILHQVDLINQVDGTFGHRNINNN